MKKCQKCRLNFSEDHFFSNRSKDEFTKICIKCREVSNARVKKFFDKNPDYIGEKTKEVRSKEWFKIVQMWRRMKVSSERRGHAKPSFTKNELTEWLYKNNFKEIHAEWVSSGHQTSMSPSIDRLDNSRGYSFENMRLVTWKENLDAWNNGGNIDHGKKCAVFLRNGKSRRTRSKNSQS